MAESKITLLPTPRRVSSINVVCVTLSSNPSLVTKDQVHNKQSKKFKRTATTNIKQKHPTEHGKSPKSCEESLTAVVSSKPQIFFSVLSHRQEYCYCRNTLKYCDITLGPYHPPILNITQYIEEISDGQYGCKCSK